MPQAISSPGSPESYDINKTYVIVLKKTVEWPAGSGFFHRPTDSHEMNGAVCKEIASDIASSFEV